MSTRYNPSIVRDSLAFYLDAVNNKSYPGSGTTWKDISGKGNDGTTDGTTFDSEGFFDFDGTNDNVKIPLTGDVNNTLFNGSNNFTVEFWFKADNLPANGGSNYQKSQALLGGGNRRCLIVFGDSLDDKEVSIRFRIGGSWNSVGSGADSIDNNRWYNMIATYDSSDGFVLYLNGDQKSTSSTTGTIETSTTAFDPDNKLIGCVSDNTSNAAYKDRFFDGKISICRIYNKVLTTTEVQQNYHAFKGRFGL